MRLQPTIDLTVTIAAEQTQGDNKPDHEPRWQSTTATRVLTSRPQHRLVVRATDDTLQGLHSFRRGLLRQFGDFTFRRVHRGHLARLGVVTNPSGQEVPFSTTPIERDWVLAGRSTECSERSGKRRRAGKESGNPMTIHAKTFVWPCRMRKRVFGFATPSRHSPCKGPPSARSILRRICSQPATSKAAAAAANPIRRRP